MIFLQSLEDFVYLESIDGDDVEGEDSESSDSDEPTH